MEGLIKGLIDVALGHDNKDDDKERSRSTWAQVESGEPDRGEEGSDRLHAYTQNRPSRQENGEFGSEKGDISGSRPSRWPQKAIFIALVWRMMRRRMVVGRLSVKSLESGHTRMRRISGMDTNVLPLSKNTLMRLKMMLI